MPSLPMDFNTEKFINEIKKRPTIWNSKCPEYVDREWKLQAWNEIVDQYSGDGNLTREERKRVCAHLQKKWRNVRDCFVKAHKARTKPGNEKKLVNYAFYEHLMFLADVANSKDSNNVINVNNGIEIKNEVNNDDEDPLSVVQELKKKKIEILVDPFSDADSATSNVNRTEERETDSNTDEEQLFFLSLVKEFRKIPENSRIQAKIDILKVIKEAQFSEWTGNGTDNSQFY